jgi:hypothetical protein
MCVCNSPLAAGQVRRGRGGGGGLLYVVQNLDAIGCERRSLTLIVEHQLIYRYTSMTSFTHYRTASPSVNSMMDIEIISILQIHSNTINAAAWRGVRFSEST